MAESLVETGARVTILEKRAHILFDLMDRNIALKRLAGGVLGSGILVTTVSAKTILFECRRLEYRCHHGTGGWFSVLPAVYGVCRKPHY